MFALPLDNSIPCVYKNNIGLHAEDVLSYTLTGQRHKADNISHTVSADVLDIQVKSARATIYNGVDIDFYLKESAASRYAYVTADFSTAYIMNPAEFKLFVLAFGTIERNSQKNGGAEKLRLKHESKALRAWLQARA